MFILITTRKTKAAKVSLLVYTPKYGHFEWSVFDYVLLCLNGARSWTSLQFVQVRTSPTSQFVQVRTSTYAEVRPDQPSSLGRENQPPRV